MLFNLLTTGAGLALYCTLTTALPQGTLVPRDSIGPPAALTRPLSLLEKRGGIGAVLGPAIADFIKGIIGQAGQTIGTAEGNGPCSICEQGGEDCNWIAGDDGAGNKWAACWFDGTETFFDFDGVTSVCLADLHGSQESVCISVEGSPCAEAYGGGIVNAQVRLGNTQLSAAGFKSIQTAIGYFVQHSTFNLNKGVVFAQVTPDLRGPTSEMIVQGHGGREC